MMSSNYFNGVVLLGYLKKRELFASKSSLFFIRIFTLIGNQIPDFHKQL
jgi:hypothetical protein